MGIEKINYKKIIRKDRNYYIFALILFVIGTIIFALSFWAMKCDTMFGGINQPLTDFLARNRINSITNILQIITNLASPGIFIVIVGILAIIWFIKNQEVWRPIALMTAIGTAASLSTMIKVLTAHPRPPLSIMVKPFELDYSFPSGHTIGIAVFVLVFSYLILSRHRTKLKTIGYLALSFTAICLIAFSRLYLGYHWLTDIIGSIGLSLIILAGIIAIDRIIIRYYQD